MRQYEANGILDTCMQTDESDDAVLVDHTGNPITPLVLPQTAMEQDGGGVANAVISSHSVLSPYDNPDVWRRSAAYDPPSNVDIEREQAAINMIGGTTRNGEPIFKLVWNGDHRFWDGYYMRWTIAGQPIGDLKRRPRIRYKVLRDADGRVVRDSFPPRWLLLTRLEPEQFAKGWKNESWVYDASIGRKKMIRPDEPPKVFWLWFMTIAKHTDYCCAKAEKEQRICYGKYVPPSFAHSALAQQVKADEQQGKRNPFADISSQTITYLHDLNTGYRQEMAEMQAMKDIYIEHPYALLGLGAMQAIGDKGIQYARNLVKEHFAKAEDALVKEGS